MKRWGSVESLLGLMGIVLMLLAGHAEHAFIVSMLLLVTRNR